EGKNYVKPKYIKNMLMKSYLITMDLEAKEIEADEKDKEENTIKEAEQIAVSYGYTIHSGYNKICVFDPETKKYLGASHRKCHGKKLMIQ
ncbi:1969_t:CDS:2, partial [Racocetra fulgida]